jgi:Flp pilus assembly protein TadG
MEARSISYRAIARLGEQIGRIWQDRCGVAAVEFAFIAPVLLCLYFVTMEVSQAIETNKKVGRAASMIADLVTQQQNTIKTEHLDPIMRIGEATLQPYNRTVLKTVITGIQITDEATPKVLVAWSRKMESGAFSRDAVAGTATTVPAALKLKGTFLVRVDAYLNYRPVVTWTTDQKQTLGLTAAFDNISMRETYYLRPRMSPAIACENC